jgi:large subunit ribosomal protein L10
LRERVASTKSLFFTDMRGLTVGEMQTLRRELRKEASTYSVVKNTLFEKALDDERRKLLESILAGPTGVAFVGEDPIGAAKALTHFASETKKLHIKAAIIDGRLYDTAEIASLAKLPRRPELLAKLVGTLKAPMYGLVSVLSGNSRKLVQLLDAIRIQKAEAA